VQDIPLRQVTRNPSAVRLIEGIGLATLGDCLNLPKPELARRAGPDLLLLLDRVLGRAPDPRPLWQPKSLFEQRLLLPEEITARSALAFPARRLAQALEFFLRGHDAVTQQLYWRFSHRDREDTVLEQGLLKPLRSSEAIVKLLRHHLESLHLPAPVLEISLQVNAWQPVPMENRDLFRSESRPHDVHLLDRLQARMGERSVRGIGTVPEYRPERAWRYRPPSGEWAGADTKQQKKKGRFTDQSALPLWLLPEPKPLRWCNGGLWHEGALQLQAFSQRLETGWWDGCDVARDYYQALDASGRRLWVFQDLHTGGWFLQGLWG